MKRRPATEVVGRPSAWCESRSRWRGRRSAPVAGPETSSTAERLDLGEPLRVGDRVVFTGCDANLRERPEKRSTSAGLRIMSGVSRTTVMLVTGDPTSEITKARSAAELGSRNVHPAATPNSSSTVSQLCPANRVRMSGISCLSATVSRSTHFSASLCECSNGYVTH